MHQLCGTGAGTDNSVKSPEREKSRNVSKFSSPTTIHFKSAARREKTPPTTIPFISREEHDDTQNTEDTALFENVEANDYMDTETYDDQYENDEQLDVKDLKKEKPTEYRHWVRRCKQCDLSFSEKSQFLDHMVSVHDKTVHKCELCDHSTIYISDLRKHFDCVHEKKKYPCTDCQYVANSASNLRVHKMSKHDGIKFPCNFCELELANRNSWRKHMNNIHGDEMLQEPE